MSEPDIVEWLIVQADAMHGDGAESSLEWKAADEITRLRSQRATMREALVNLANAADDVGVKYFDTDTMEPLVDALQKATATARAALASTEAAGEETK